MATTKEKAPKTGGTPKAGKGVAIEADLEVEAAGAASNA